MPNPAAARRIITRAYAISCPISQGAALLAHPLPRGGHPHACRARQHWPMLPPFLSSCGTLGGAHVYFRARIYGKYEIDRWDKSGGGGGTCPGWRACASVLDGGRELKRLQGLGKDVLRRAPVVGWCADTQAVMWYGGLHQLDVALGPSWVWCAASGLGDGLTVRLALVATVR